MLTQQRAQTVEDFERFIQQPENVDRLFEYIGGEIVSLPSLCFTSLTVFLFCP